MKQQEYEIVPLEDRLVVEREEVAAQTVSGLYLPDNALEKSRRARVLAVGPAVEALRPGAIVLIGKYSGTEVEVDGAMLVVLRESEVIAGIAPVSA